MTDFCRSQLPAKSQCDSNPYAQGQFSSRVICMEALRQGKLRSKSKTLCTRMYEITLAKRFSEGNTGPRKDSHRIVLLGTCSNLSDCLLIAILFKHFRHPGRPSTSSIPRFSSGTTYFAIPEDHPRHPERPATSSIPRFSSGTT
jgi:hypothetical protein